MSLALITKSVAIYFQSKKKNFFATNFAWVTEIKNFSLTGCSWENIESLEFGV